MKTKFYTLAILAALASTQAHANECEMSFKIDQKNLMVSDCQVKLHSNLDPKGGHYAVAKVDFKSGEEWHLVFMDLNKKIRSKYQNVVLKKYEDGRYVEAYSGQTRIHITADGQDQNRRVIQMETLRLKHNEKPGVAKKVSTSVNWKLPGES